MRQQIIYYQKSVIAKANAYVVEIADLNRFAGLLGSKSISGTPRRLCLGSAFSSSPALKRPRNVSWLYAWIAGQEERSPAKKTARHSKICIAAYDFDGNDTVHSADTSGQARVSASGYHGFVSKGVCNL